MILEQAKEYKELKAKRAAEAKEQEAINLANQNKSPKRKKTVRVAEDQGAIKQESQ